jgi:hypothetical protein
MIGTCSIYNGENNRTKEKRSLRATSSAEIFNLLNDLNNVSIITPDDEVVKLDYEIKQKIINDSINNNKPISIANFVKNINEYFKINITKLELKGLRIDKKHELLITDLPHTRFFKCCFFKNDFDITNLISDITYLDKINECANAISQGGITVEEKINSFLKENPESMIDEKSLSKYLEKNKSNYSQTHSLSIKALNEIIQKMLLKCCNQMEIIATLYPLKANDFSRNSSHFSKEEIEKITSEILSPSVKKSVTYTLKVLNEYFKKCKKENVEVKKISIELARERNSAEIKSSQDELVTINENRNKKIIELFGDIGSQSTKYKLSLLLQQD